ncbi:MAG: reverse gyrase [Spirochaetia bacterium]|nr:reverse gyrase [Spirochaetota bacterium]MCX8095989.1 reverse gyrase [Spirochaetota bacterium]MDW8113022.1 reverse gyrase [Spirochaetia bacterium]
MDSLVIYKRGCLVCGGEITDDRLRTVGICNRCYNKQVSENLDSIFIQFKSSDRISSLLHLKNEIDKWVGVFKNLIGSPPWNTQVSWMKRVILGRSFSLVAPTGVGKTTFGIITAINLSRNGKKSLIIVPTTNLVHQVYEKISGMMKDSSSKVIMYSSKLTPKQKDEFKRRIVEKDYDIVVITSSMVKNLLSISNYLNFDFIFADDIDSILKKSKNIEYIIMLSGVSKEDINTTLDYIKHKFLLVVSKGKDKYEDYLKRYKELQEEVERVKNKNKGIIVVSSATAKPKGARIKLFKELFNFEVGGRTEIVRNISNYYIHSDNYEDKLLEVINLLGDGGLVFVSTEDGVEYAEKVSKVINSKTKFKSAVVSSQKTDKGLEKFKKGEINVLVGVSTYYGTLVRGIDIPDRIVYSVFLGVPKFKVLIDPEKLNVSGYQIVKILSEVVDSIDNLQERRKVESIIKRIRSSPNYEMFIKTGKEILAKILKENKYIEILKSSQDIVFRNINGNNYLIIPDINTYIQASGRTSRLYVGGMTKGISVIVEGDKKLLDVSARKYKWIEDVEWKEFDKEKVLEDLEIAKKDRERLKLSIKGQVESEIRNMNKTVLIIVESPTKAKTISKLLGNPTERVIRGLSCYEVTTGNITFIITASKGHIFELTTDQEDFYGIRIVNDKPIPVYDAIKSSRSGKAFVGSEEKNVFKSGEEYTDRFEDIISLIELAKEVDEILLASDPDTEGEKISFDIYSFLNIYMNFFGGNVKRMRFNEVTYSAIVRSIQNPDSVNFNLVEAQLLRRIQDRVIGFGLSNFLMYEHSYGRNISAGRVQSPVLGWIVDRYKEYNETKSSFIDVILSNDNGDKLSLSFEDDGNEISLKEGDLITPVLVEEKEIDFMPLPPFTTDTVLVQSNRLFRMSSDSVMSILQDLFEEGFITYHRTESTTVSSVGMNVAKDYLSSRELLKFWFARSWEEEGAHECIRPTRSIDAQTLSQLINEGVISTSTLKRQHIMVYDLIFKRFISSQMKPVVVKNAKYQLNLGKKVVEISRNVEIVEDGWNRVGYLQVDKPLDVLKVEKVRKVKKPKVALLSEGDVIQMMKERGIGRPSTYSKIISILSKRGYVISKNNKLIPLKKGIEVYFSLKEKYREFISEERTRILEEMMDKVEKGSKDYLYAVKEILEEVRNATSR